jgi:hypothetical protein
MAGGPTSILTTGPGSWCRWIELLIEDENGEPLNVGRKTRTIDVTSIFRSRLELE